MDKNEQMEIDTSLQHYLNGTMNNGLQLAVKNLFNPHFREPKKELLKFATLSKSKHADFTWNGDENDSE